MVATTFNTSMITTKRMPEGEELTFLSIEEQITALYIAIFGRAPDLAGLEYWEGEIDSGNMTIDGVAQSFFDQPEAMSIFPPDSDMEQFVTDVYKNIFNTEPPSREGTEDLTNSLEDHIVSKYEYVLALIDIAQRDQQDANSLKEMCDLALDFAESNGEDIEAAHAVIEAYKEAHPVEDGEGIPEDSGNEKENPEEGDEPAYPIISKPSEDEGSSGGEEAPESSGSSGTPSIPSFSFMVEHNDTLSGTHITEDDIDELIGVSFDDMGDMLV